MTPFPHTPSARRTGPARALLGLAGLGAALALGLGAARSDAAVSQTMHAFVHVDESIGLTFDDGSAVGSQGREPPTIPAGTYTIRVVDDTDEHNFHLYGPGVDLETSTGESASTTWTATFQAGATYRYVCDTHADFMFGAFQAAGGSTGSTSGGSSGGSTGGSSGGSAGGSSSGSGGGTVSSGRASSGSLLGTLSATLDASGKARLLVGGRPVTRLQAGRYRIAVSDRARSRSFVVQRAGRAAVVVSGAAFVGKRSATLVLGAGRWSFYAAPGGRKTSFTVAA